MKMDAGPNKTMLLFLFIALLRLSSAYIQPEGNVRVLDERLAEYQREAQRISPYLRNHICCRSRLECYPCTFRKPSTTKVPGLNEYGTYTTKFRRSNCEILRRKHSVGAIPVINKFAEPVFTIFSPGFFQSPKQNYGNNQLSFYNISCRKGQFIFFNMTDLDMQNSSCVDPNENQKKCVDYVQLRLNNGLLVSENCGSDTTGVKEQIFPFDSLKMVFRSNSAYRYRGFSASAVCFNPGSQPIQGSQLNQGHSCHQPNLGSELNQGHGSQPTQGLQGGSSSATEVPYGVDVIYRSHRLDFVERETGRITLEKRLENMTINFLQTISMSGEEQEFRSSIPNRLQGPGVLFRSNDRAYFQKFLVDTTALQPNALELQLIANFNHANQRLVPRTPVEDPTLLPTEPPTQRCIEVKPITLQPRFTLRPLTTPPLRFIPEIRLTLPTRFLSRQKRTSSSSPRLCLTALPQRKKRIVTLSQGTSGLSDKVLAQSIRNNDACNPILKASATALKNQLKIENSDRLNLLFAALPDMDVLTAASRS